MTALSRRLSLSVLAAGFTSGLLSSPIDAAAASSPKACAAVARKAKARLAQSVIACGRRDLTTEIGRCGADRWKQYTDRLAQRGCAATADTRAKRIRHPVVARIQSEFSADDLAAADVEAREAHLALCRLLERLLRTADAARHGHLDSLAALQRLAQDLADAMARYDDADATLAAVEEAIWHGFAGDPSLAWLIDEPLRAATQQMQIELRRLLGPEWQTEIVALRDEPGCRGDLIGDRMIAAYGDAVLASGSGRSGEAAALGRIAGQLACLSIRQTALVDVAVSVAADRVEQLLDEAGLARIRGDFARIVAPVQLLVLDTVKIAGDHAYAWHWFVERHDLLLDEVARHGWATSDVVWLYDRIDGRMIGFPPCDAESAFGRCVDQRAFLDSLVDPRALGIGDCALSGMVAGGLRHAGGLDRYACPSTDCGTASSGKGTSIGGTTGGARTPAFPSFGGGGTASGSHDLPWGGLTSSDLSIMRGFGCGGASVGGGGGSSSGDDGGGGSQGPGGSLGDWGGRQECVQQALQAPRDPYSVYVRCVADVAADQRAQALDFTGVPMGPDCKPGVAAPSGGSTPPSGGSTTTTAPASSATTSTVVSTDPTTTTAPPSASPPCVPTGFFDAIQKMVDCGLAPLSKYLTGDTPTPSAAGAVVSTEIELLKPANAKTFIDTSAAVLQHNIDLNCAAGVYSDDMCAQLADMKPGEQAEYLRNHGHMDCADPEQCESDCTTLDAQVMQRMEDCQQELTNTLAPPPGGQNAPGTRIRPSPESDPGHLPDDPFLDCLLAGADGAPTGIDLGCALVSCVNPGATRTGSACCGAATPTIGVSLARIITERTCETVHCTDGQSVVADGLGDCGCGNGVPLSGGGNPNPAPSPEAPRPPRK
jgi:hypothetical protein